MRVSCSSLATPPPLVVACTAARVFLSIAHRRGPSPFPLFFVFSFPITAAQQPAQPPALSVPFVWCTLSTPFHAGAGFAIAFCMGRSPGNQIPRPRCATAPLRRRRTEPPRTKPYVLPTLLTIRETCPNPRACLPFLQIPPRGRAVVFGAAAAQAAFAHVRFVSTGQCFPSQVGWGRARADLCRLGQLCTGPLSCTFHASCARICLRSFRAATFSLCGVPSGPSGARARPPRLNTAFCPRPPRPFLTRPAGRSVTESGDTPLCEQERSLSLSWLGH